MYNPDLTGEEEETKVIPFLSLVKPVEDYQSESEKLLQKRKDEIIRLTNEQRDAAFAQGYEEGKVQGYQDGYQEGLNTANENAQQQLSEEIRNFADQLKSKVNEVSGQMDTWYQRAEEQLAFLSVAVAEQILKLEVQTNREVVISLVQEATKELLEDTKVKIRINPFDLDIMLQRKEEILQYTGHLTEVDIVEDPSIMGGCVIEADKSVIDARIEQMIQNLGKFVREDQ